MISSARQPKDSTKNLSVKNRADACSIRRALMRAYRVGEVHGNAYRRPRRYGMIVSDEVKEPFVRGDRVER